jgi:two-component system chemotaxis response regulator CheB
MAGHDLIVIGASAGGLQALQEIIGGLPKDLPAAVLVVVHTAPTGSGMLPQILGRVSQLPIAFAKDGDAIEHSRIYVAPPDHHLLIKSTSICLTRGPKENGFRPAVDPLFRTAARAYGPRVIGVILSGGLDDGTLGLAIIKQFGGVAVVQDPDEAMAPGMPASAIQNVQIDHVLEVAQMPRVLSELAQQPVPEGLDPMTHPQGEDPDIAELGAASLLDRSRPYPPSEFTCPQCGGALWELRDGNVPRFRCHVGHGYTGQSLIAEQTDEVEAALWTALRALEENAALQRRLAERARQGNWPLVEKSYREAASNAESRAAVIRKVLVSEPGDAKKMKGSHPKHPRGNGEGGTAVSQTKRKSLSSRFAIKAGASRKKVRKRQD